MGKWGKVKVYRGTLCSLCKLSINLKLSHTNPLFKREIMV